MDKGILHVCSMSYLALSLEELGMQIITPDILHENNDTTDGCRPSTDVLSLYTTMAYSNTRTKRTSSFSPPQILQHNRSESCMLSIDHEYRSSSIAKLIFRASQSHVEESKEDRSSLCGPQLHKSHDLIRASFDCTCTPDY